MLMPPCERAVRRARVIGLPISTRSIPWPIGHSDSIDQADMSTSIGLGAVIVGGLVFTGFWLYRSSQALGGADWGNVWLNSLDRFNRLFCRYYHGMQHPSVSLPEQGPALVVANHVSGLDPLLMVAACQRPLRFIIAREEYERRGFKWLYRAVGCIPVDRERRPERALRAALRALQNGEVVALFPHGKIHLASDPPSPLKPGVAKLAHLACAPIYPLHLSGIRGQGKVIAAVFIRSKAQVKSLPALDCQGLPLRECLHRLASLLEGKDL
jgi:1-acyl-sn-glycerol-3-phosphate acyltransferase